MDWMRRGVPQMGWGTRWTAIGLVYAIVLVGIALIFCQGDWFVFVNLGREMIVEDGIRWRQGTDGQFAYLIASAPLNAVPELDVPAYRLQRILYPALAWLAALGQAACVPVTLVLVNVLALGLGTGAFAILLKQEDAPFWIPALFFLWFGTSQALLFDLNEITAMCLALWALVFFSRGQLGASQILFGLGALAKDLAFLFAIPAVIRLLRLKDYKVAVQFAMVSAAPYVIWMMVLRLLLGTWSFDAPATRFSLIPLGGLSWLDPSTPLTIGLLVLPGLMCAFWALQHLDDVYAWATLFSFAYLIFLPRYSLAAYAVFRLAIPLVLASALLLARLRHKRWLVYCAAAWSSTAVLTLAVAVTNPE